MCGASAEESPPPLHAVPDVSHILYVAKHLANYLCRVRTRGRWGGGGLQKRGIEKLKGVGAREVEDCFEVGCNGVRRYFGGIRRWDMREG